MNYFSMFSGVGGFERGIEQASPVSCCIGFSEIDKHAVAIYKHRFPGHRNYGSATDIDTDGLPDFDLLVGGFPCQDFSIAGKRSGLDGTRGTLFFEIARVLEAKRPRAFLLENVKGLFSSDSGRSFRRIIRVLNDIGYFLEWDCLNSKNYGVAQNRERVFIVGHFGGIPRREVFPLGDCCEKADNELIQIGNIDTKGHNSIWGRVYSPEGISSNLNSEGGGLGAKTGLYAIPVLTPDRDKRQQGRRFKEAGDPSFTLTGQDIHGVMITDKKGKPKRNTDHASCLSGGAHSGDNHSDMDLLHLNARIRRLTPLECERLQGFPDGWTEFGDYDGEVKPVSDTQRYKTMGNAVTVNVIEAIIRKMREVGRFE